MSVIASNPGRRYRPFRNSLFKLSSGRNNSRTTSILLILPLVFLLTLGFFYPVGKMLLNSLFDPHFTLENYIRIFREPLYIKVLLRTFEIALYVTLGCIVFGYPVAYAMARLKSFWASIVAVCVLVPLWTSVLVRSYAWIILFQRNGIVNDALIASGIVDQPLKILYTEVAVIVAMIHVLLPFAILPIFSVLKTLPDDLSRAALNLGASNAQVFMNVIFPLSLPGVFAAALMTFILALGFYITPAIVGGPQVLMMATLIGQQATTLLDWPFAGALATTLLVITLIIAFVFRKILSYSKGFEYGH